MDGSNPATINLGGVFFGDNSLCQVINQITLNKGHGVILIKNVE